VRRSRISTLGFGLAGALLASALIPGVAAAAPGDASARGVVFDLNAGVLGVAVVTADAVAGAADAPAGGGTDTDTPVDVAGPLAGAVGVTATGSVDEVTATRGATASTAFARVSAFTLGVLGIPVLATTGDVTATANCPLTGALTAATTLAGLTVFGVPTTLTANTPATTATAAVTVAGLTGAQLTVALTRVETTVDPNATAITVRATLSLTGTVNGAPTTIPLGGVTIASATCTRPTVAPPIPTVTTLDPTSGPTAGGTTVTINGSNFVPGTTVTFGGLPATVVSRTDTAVVVRTPAHPAGPVDVTIANANGTATLPAGFTYLAAPTATGINPTSGPTAGGQTVTITGSGFVPGATTVTFDGVEATGVVVAPGGTSLTAVTPAGSAGPAQVEVATAGGRSARLAYTYAAVPTVTALAPTSGPTSGGTTVTITGTGLAGTTQVAFGGAPAAIVSRTANSVVVRTPAHAAGAVDVTVTTPSGTDTLAGAFTYTPADTGSGGGTGSGTGGTGGSGGTGGGSGVGGDGTAAAPALSALTPDRGPVAGGQTVVITGSGFVAGSTTVTFDGVPAASVAVVDDDTLVVRTPAGVAGPASVVVAVDGVASGPLTYTYVAGATVPPAPTADSLDPDSGPAGGGTRVTVHGRNFVRGQTSVIVCGTTLLPADVEVAAGGRSVSFSTPACPAGATDVVVVTPGGVAVALPFTYTDAAGAGSGSGSGVSGSGSLANTGTDPVGIGLLGIGLVLAGGVIARLARRRPAVLA
jgi:hypothetical protein